jgi:hypothetical protein
MSRKRPKDARPLIEVRRADAPRVPIPPPLPSIDDLEALAASDEPTAQGAWWVTTQVVEHVLAIAVSRDPRTGAPTPQSLMDYLTSLDRMTEGGRRPLPCDNLAFAAGFAAQPMAEIIARHRTRLVRSHEQIAFHRLRDMDPRSLAWLAQLPGRNVREKLAGRTQALGVRRRVTPDTPENRVVRSVADFLAERIGQRLSYVSAYDQTDDSVSRAALLGDTFDLCGQRMRRSELGEIPMAVHVRPNNVLIGDPDYSRLYRTWRLLRDHDHAVKVNWPRLGDRATTVLKLLVAARFVRDPRIAFWDGLGRVSLGSDSAAFGLQQTAGIGSAREWATDIPLEFHVVPGRKRNESYLVQLSASGCAILTTVVSLDGDGLQVHGASQTSRIEIQIAGAPLVARRGIRVTARGCTLANGTSVSEQGDLEGLGALADAIAAQVLSQCGIQIPKGTRHRTVATVAPIKSRHIGIAIHATRFRVDTGGGETLVQKIESWVGADDLARGEGRAWLPGRADRRLRFGFGNARICSLSDALDFEREDDIGTLALATSRVVDELARRLDGAASARVAYSVPDAIDEFSQRSLRAAMNSRFRNSVPVWRSICAAVGWQSTQDFGAQTVGSGEHVAIVDAEFSDVTITILEARHDPKLEANDPLTKGIYWIRKPPLPHDETLDMLGWQAFLEQYAENTILQSLGGQDALLTTDERRALAEDLVRTNVADGLLGKVNRTYVAVSPRDSSSAILQLQHDPDGFNRLVERWSKRLARSVDDALSKRLRGVVPTHVLLVGEAMGHSDTRRAAGDAVRMGLYSSKASRVHDIRPHILAMGARQAVMRRDANCRVWMEWLPDMALEVIRGGHYGELHLLDKNVVVDPFLGEAQSFKVDAPLVLPRGQSWFSFPVMIGEGGTRPLAWEARVESPAFPLAHHVPISLRLDYYYGLETSYRLTVEPASGAAAPFGALEAKWTSAIRQTSAQLSLKSDPVRSLEWDDVEARRFADAVQGLNKRGDRHYLQSLLDLCRRCWSNGRSCDNAPTFVIRAYADLCDMLLEQAICSDLNPKDIPIELAILCHLHVDAPAQAVETAMRLDDMAADEYFLDTFGDRGAREVPTCRWSQRLLRGLVGNAAGDGRIVLDAIVERLRRHTAFETFDPRLANETLASLNFALWRSPGVVAAVGENGGASLLIGQAGRTFKNLLSRVPAMSVSRDRADIDGIKVRYWRPYQLACETLLLLLRLRSTESGAGLRAGTPSADAMAKAIRQLDARFMRYGARGWWEHGLQDVDLPPNLKNVSPITYVLSCCLAGTAETNLLEVSDAVPSAP